MDIQPDEVESVEIIGELNDSDVKIVKLYGGFHMAVGLKKKGKKKAEVLAAGSHPALISHQLGKEFDDGFKPKLCKSEHPLFPKVEEFTDDLSENLSNMGLEVFALSKDNHIDFIVSKFGIDVVKYETDYCKNEMVVKSYSKNKSIGIHPDISSDLAKIIDKKCKSLGINKIKKEV